VPFRTPGYPQAYVHSAVQTGWGGRKGRGGERKKGGGGEGEGEEGKRETKPDYVSLVCSSVVAVFIVPVPSLHGNNFTGFLRRKKERKERTP